MKRPCLPSAIVWITGLIMLSSPAAAQQDEWKFGIGTGFFALNIEGDAGFATGLGPVELGASLDTGDVQELLDSAAGLGGYAAKGKWVLQYSGGQLKLEDELTGTGPMGSPTTAVASFTGTSAEFTASYRFALTGKHAWGILGGVRYTKHEFDFDLTIDNNPPNPPAAFSRDIEQDWTDGLIGLTHAARLGDKWSWSNRLDAGFGGSEGTYFLRTNFGWQFAKSWALNIYAQNVSIEYENEEPGDPDWYLYDADEYGAGLNVLYTW